MSNYLTIPGFESLTQQQIFDLGLAHIRKTRTKGTHDVTGDRQICSYQGSGCVASVLLREEARKDADVHGAWPDLVVAYHVPKIHSDFIRDMQELHDDCANGLGFMKDFENHMKTFAEENNLNYEPEVPA